LEILDIVNINKVSLLFLIERSFGFLYEANLDHLINPSTPSMEQFFKNPNFAFNFHAQSWSLSIGDNQIERIKKSVLESKQSTIDQKIEIMDKYLLAISHRSDVDMNFVTETYCEYADLLLLRGKPDDFDTAERNITRVMDTICRKDSFEMVSSV
jgi:hypothetical protein